jgi:hypothetical protein
MGKAFIAVLILSLTMTASAQALHVVHARGLHEQTGANVPAFNPVLEELPPPDFTRRV